MDRIETGERRTRHIVTPTRDAEKRLSDPGHDSHDLRADPEQVVNLIETEAGATLRVSMRTALERLLHN